MNIIIHRGTHEIGGNCVEVQSGSTRLILDVGLPLVDEHGQPFDTAVLRGASVPHLLENHILPTVLGLFDDPADNATPPDAILLSHSHADHVGLVPYTRRTIPIYLSKGTSKMILAGSLFAGQKDLQGHECRSDFRLGESFVIGNFRITAYNVDHSAFDSLAFIIEADGQTLLYTGDMRLHGRKPGMAARLIQAAQGRIDVVLMEGTHPEPAPEARRTEEDLEWQIAGHIRESRGLVLAAFSPMHVDRLVTFLKASMRTGRTFVADAYTAFVMYLIISQCDIPDPRKKQREVQVYYNQGFPTRRQHCAYDKFLNNRVEMDEILKRPEKYVMLFRPGMIDKDFRGRLPGNCLCIYSYWAGYLERQQWEGVSAQVQAVGGRFVTAHTSGHIFAEDTAEFLRQIAPGLVIPVHTFQPKLFHALVHPVYVPDDGQRLDVGQLLAEHPQAQ